MKSDADIIKSFKKNKANAISGLSKQKANTNKAYSFYEGDLCDITKEYALDDKKIMVKINKVKPLVSSIVGFMAQNRREASYSAKVIDSTAQKYYSSYSNTVKNYIRENGNFDQAETRQDRDMVVCGYGATETAMSYGDGYATRNDNGEVIMVNIDAQTVLWDPSARAPNLLDARFVAYPREYSLDDALNLFDSSTKDDFEYDGNDESQGDFKPIKNGGIYDRERISENYEMGQSEDNIKVWFYQWYDIVQLYRAENPLKILVNPISRQAAYDLMLEIQAENENDIDSGFQFKADDDVIVFDEKIRARLKELLGNKFLQDFKFNKKIYRTAIISGKKVFTKYTNISQEGFTVKFKTGDWNPISKVWVGIVNQMMEPVQYFNKALTELMFIIASNSKGGWFVEDDATDDMKNFNDTVSKTNGVTVLNSGALGAGKVQSKATALIPTGYESIVEFSDRALIDASGIDRAFLGSVDSGMETAMLNRQRIKQVISVLACYFDAITLYSKEHARLMLDFMRVFVENNQGTLFRIVGEKGAKEYIELSKDRLAAEYDVDINEAPETVDEKAGQNEKLLMMADKLLMAGDQTAKKFYALYLKNSNIPDEDKAPIIDSLDPKEDNKYTPEYALQLEKQLEQINNELAQLEMQKKKNEIILQEGDIEQKRIDMQKKSAETVRIISETEKIEAETQFAQTLPSGQVNVNL